MGGIDVRSDSNHIGWNNEIRNASAFGIRIDGGKNNRITENLRAANAGIVLANSGNHALPAPRLDSVVVSGDQALVRGFRSGRHRSISSSSLPATNAKGSDDSSDPVHRDQSRFLFQIPAIKPGSFVTAVAIDRSFSLETGGDASVFSNCITATGTAAVAAPVLISVTAEGWRGDVVLLNGTNIHALTPPATVLLPLTRHGQRPNSNSRWLCRLWRAVVAS